MRPVPVALIDEARCIGCTLCIAACPVDCIDMVPRAGEWTLQLKRAAGARARRRRIRLKARQVAPGPRDRKAVLKKLLGER